MSRLGPMRPGGRRGLGSILVGSVTAARGGLDWLIETRFGLGFLSAYLLAALYFGGLVWTSNPKLSLGEAVATGIAWPVQVGRLILDAEVWRHRGPAANEPCTAAGRNTCGLG